MPVSATERYGVGWIDYRTTFDGQFGSSPNTPAPDPHPYRVAVLWLIFGVDALLALAIAAMHLVP